MFLPSVDFLKQSIANIIFFLKVQKKTMFLTIGLLLLFLIVYFSLLVLTENYNELSRTFDVKQNQYIKTQTERLNRLSTPSQENESLFDFYKKKSFDQAVKNGQAQKVVEKIKRQLHLEICKISSGSDVLMDSALKIYSKKLTFDIQSNSSEKIYKFIDRLYHLLPGLITLKKFTISNGASLKTKKPKESQYAFMSKIEFDWIRQKKE
ncbi:MAG: hypothetical protein KBD31_04510 [Proteobacteria bacterium]|nr:hypothetical protein [Pseudomonadota bacterium]